MVGRPVRAAPYQGRHRRPCGAMFQRKPYTPVDVCNLQAGHTSPHKGRYRSQQWDQETLPLSPTPGQISRARTRKQIRTDTGEYRLRDYSQDTPTGTAQQAHHATRARLDRRRST